MPFYFGTEKEGFEPSRRYSRPTPFPGEPLQPLGYFSKVTDSYPYYRSLSIMINRAERMGFEPMCPCGQTVFKTASL